MNPRIVYRCESCGDYFHEEREVCPDGDGGSLVKICNFCGENFEKCSCSEEELARKCHKCGVIKTECKCSA